MSDLFKGFDNFGYTPQFLISGEKNYKSKIGGLTFLLFLIFAIFYFVNQSYSFIKNMDDVDNSRDVLTNSKTYNLTSKEFYFGVGFIDITNTEYNISMFPYFNIYIEIVTKFMNGTRTNIQIPMTTCDVNLLLDQDSLSQYIEEHLANIKNKTKYYLCPTSNFSEVFQSNYCGGNQIILQIKLDFTNTSILSEVKEQINQIRPRLNFVYKNVFIDTLNKSHPYYGTIDTLYSAIDYQTAKKIDLSLDPYEIFDDHNIFGGIEYSKLETDSSNQPDSTVFQTSINNAQFGIYENRTQNLSFNNNEPYLNFFKIRMLLNPALRVTYRSYKKFAFFVAEVTSILSNLLMICTIIMIKYNSIRGQNKMIKSMFTHNSIKNLKSFKDDFIPIFEERKKYILIHQEKNSNNNLVGVNGINISLISPLVEQSNLSFIFR